ncbi:hypothetical protein M0804_013536 [Polistes exclamans]|nr:hypothetical protein M0804_013536 [Polistes exclamans]
MGLHPIIEVKQLWSRLGDGWVTRFVGWVLFQGRLVFKELKIKAGAEKLREVATDRKALSDVATIVKKANSKLNELQAELQQLESQIILTQGQPQSPQQNHSNGQECNLDDQSIQIYYRICLGNQW